MNQQILDKIEELLNYYNNFELMYRIEGDEKMRDWGYNHKMGLYALLHEFGYDYERDESGKLKVFKVGCNESNN